MLEINEYPEGVSSSTEKIISSIPFKVKHFVEVSNLPDGEVSQGHANKESEKFLLCFCGNVEIKTVSKDNGVFSEKTYTLKEEDFLYVPPMTWTEQTHNNNGIIHMLYSRKYNEEDYVEDYEEFKQI